MNKIEKNISPSTFLRGNHGWHIPIYLVYSFKIFFSLYRNAYAPIYIYGTIRILNKNGIMQCIVFCNLNFSLTLTSGQVRIGSSPGFH